jgi:hypothetical protein
MAAGGRSGRAVRDRHGGERQPGRRRDSLAPGRRTPAGEDVQDHVGTHRAAGERFLAGQGDGVEALGQDRCQNGDELPVRLVTAPEPAADPCQRRWTPPTSPSRSVNDSKEGSPMAMELLAIDLGKQSFHLHGIDADGVVVSRRVSRTKLEQVVHELAPKIVAMEACASSHDWGRRFERDFLQVRLINPRFVKPFVRGSKNDTADAEAIFEAASRPTMFP